jgi:glyoxylase-like metal-dependent hydrolase (beta-lactamase superfamily II)
LRLEHAAGEWSLGPDLSQCPLIMARRELEAAEAGRNDGGDRTYDYNVLPVVEAGRVVVVDMDHAVYDEVRLEPTPGHTPGHVAIRIRSSGQEAVFSGDLMHWPMQCIYPDWRFRGDSDPDLARRTRWAFLESCAENRRIVITSHFPLPSLGTITRRQASFWFEDYPSLPPTKHGVS